MAFPFTVFTDFGDKTNSAFKRGGNWNNTSNAGAFALNLNNGPSNTNTNIGFRCAR
jgi:formylglycine-generating enzyme required for sulfatase activity